MIDAVIFDCDGTLLDSMPAWHDLEERFAREAGITLSKEHLDILNANTLQETAAYFHERCGLGESSAAVLRRAREILLEAYRSEVMPRPGAVELVERLKSDGVKLAVASSSTAAFLEAGLQRAGIYRLFDLVFSAEDEGATKRDPRFVLSVADRLGAQPGSSWCVDDSAYALEAMREAGFHTLGIYDSDIAGTRRQLALVAEASIDSFTQLDYERFLAGGYARSAQATARAGRTPFD